MGAEVDYVPVQTRVQRHGILAQGLQLVLGLNHVEPNFVSVLRARARGVLVPGPLLEFLHHPVTTERFVFLNRGRARRQEDKG